MKIDTLNQVRQRLRADDGRLRKVATESGLSYDTVLRIKNEEGDPGYSKVRILAEHYGIAPRVKKRKAV